jgi:hypothetical protein
MDPLAEKTDTEPELQVLIRDVVVFQFKLLLDGLRDLVLVPASLIAGVISVVRTRNGAPGSQFYRLVGMGKQSERWINLFGAMRNAPADVVDENQFGPNDIDEIVSKIETFVVDEYKRGGVTAQARDSLQKAMKKMRGKANETKPPP